MKKLALILLVLWGLGAALNWAKRARKANAPAPPSAAPTSPDSGPGAARLIAPRPRPPATREAPASGPSSGWTSDTSVISRIYPRASRPAPDRQVLYPNAGQLTEPPRINHDSLRRVADCRKARETLRSVQDAEKYPDLVTLRRYDDFRGRSVSPEELARLHQQTERYLAENCRQ